MKPNSVALIGICPNCGESVRVIVNKKQLKTLLKGFKTSNPRDAEMLVEKILKRDMMEYLKE